MSEARNKSPQRPARDHKKSSADSARLRAAWDTSTAHAMARGSYMSKVAGISYLLFELARALAEADGAAEGAELGRGAPGTT